MSKGGAGEAARALGEPGRHWATREKGKDGRAWLAPGVGLPAGLRLKRRKREVERAEQGKGEEWVGPEGIPGWATRLIWFFLFPFLFYFLFQTKLDLFEFK